MKEQGSMFDVGARIKEIRNMSNMTTTELSYRLGFKPKTQNYISAIENNLKPCKLNLLFKICEVFNISLHEFFNDKEIPTPTIESNELFDLIQLVKTLDSKRISELIYLITNDEITKSE